VAHERRDRQPRSPTRIRSSLVALGELFVAETSLNRSKLKPVVVMLRPLSGVLITGSRRHSFGQSRIRLTQDWVIQNYMFLVTPPEVDDTAGKSPSHEGLHLALQRLIDF
jgi:hypothetical protein